LAHAAIVIAVAERLGLRELAAGRAARTQVVGRGTGGGLRICCGRRNVPFASLLSGRRSGHRRCRPWGFHRPRLGERRQAVAAVVVAISGGLVAGLVAALARHFLICRCRGGGNDGWLRRRLYPSACRACRRFGHRRRRWGRRLRLARAAEELAIAAWNLPRLLAASGAHGLEAPR
jgi:hypothetical protein